MKTTLRPVVRFTIRHGVAFLSSHPMVHRAVKTTYPLIPGLRPVLNRLRPPLPVPAVEPAPAVAATDGSYQFGARPPQPGRPLDIDALNYLSRSL